MQADDEAMRAALAQHLDLGAEELNRLVVPAERGVAEVLQRVALAVRASHAFVHGRGDARAELPDRAIELLVALYHLDAGEAHDPAEVLALLRAAEDCFQTSHAC